MKTWLIALVMLGLFIMTALKVQDSVRTASQELTRDLGSVAAEIETQHWSKALLKMGDSERRWNKTKPGWAILLHHEEIDLIEQTLVRAKQAIISRDNTSARIELGALRQSLRHIPEREKLSLVNVF